MRESGKRDVSEYEFTLKPVTERRVPTFQRVISRARALTSSSAEWEQGKSIGNARIYHQRPLEENGLRWFARVSEHSGKHGGNAFNQLWSLLGDKDRFALEIQYNRLLTSATMLNVVEWGEVWSLHYTFISPFAPRTCTVLTTAHLETKNPNTPRTAWRIYLPFAINGNDNPLALFEEPGIVGRFIVVERIKESENGNVEWLTAWTVNFGGSLPLWLNQRIATNRMAAMIPKVDELLEKRARESPTRPPPEAQTPHLPTI